MAAWLDVGAADAFLILASNEIQLSRTIQLHYEPALLIQSDLLYSTRICPARSCMRTVLLFFTVLLIPLSPIPNQPSHDIWIQFISSEGSEIYIGWNNLTIKRVPTLYKPLAIQFLLSYIRTNALVTWQGPASATPSTILWEKCNRRTIRECAGERFVTGILNPPVTLSPPQKIHKIHMRSDKEETASSRKDYLEVDIPIGLKLLNVCRREKVSISLALAFFRHSYNPQVLSSYRAAALHDKIGYWDW